MEKILSLFCLQEREKPLLSIDGYLMEGLVIIVSPLLSLMEDQVTQLQNEGETVAAFNSLLSQSERRYVLRHLSQYKFCFESRNVD